MDGKLRNKVLLCGFILLGAAGFCVNGKSAAAAETPAYTLTKGKRVTISNIIKKNPLTSENKSKYSKLKWKSSNKKIVKVINNKKLKGLKKGKVYIRGYNAKKKRILSIRVTVGKKVSKISVAQSPLALFVGREAKLSAKVSPAGASNKKLFYSSSNPAVATVSKTGKVTAAASGKAVITITSKDGGKTKKVTVNVQSELLRTTSKGSVMGIEEEGGKALTWYGIPYGASTGGMNRWKAPQPVEPWSGTRSAVTPREAAAQGGDGTNYTGTEDCLYVNVHRPNNGQNNLPVMVFVHGGGNAGGSANDSFSSMVPTSNAIVVSVEYRVGAFGFLSHEALRTGTDEENSGNFALLDIKAALSWVRDEIANFGGNPGNVTLSGFSAGARNVMLCMISPRMSGLFHKVIAFSGGFTTCTNEDGQKSVNEKLAAILVSRGNFANKSSALTYIEHASNAEIRDLFYSLTTAEVAGMYRSTSLKLDKFPQCFNDGVVVPKEGASVIANGMYNRVPMILGTDASEFSNYAWNGNLTSELDDVAGITSSSQMINLVANGVKYGSMLQSGFYLEKPASLFVQDAAHPDIYAYRFKWGTNPDVTDGFYSKFVGAFHGSSKEFLRGIYKNSFKDYSPNAISSDNRAGRVELTSVMQKYIGNFLANGNPNGADLTNWGTWNNVPGVPKVMSFDANKTKSIVQMSGEYYDEMSTFAQMRAGLSKSEYNILVNSLFANRFFMPEQPPAY